MLNNTNLLTDAPAAFRTFISIQLLLTIGISDLFSGRRQHFLIALDIHPGHSNGEGYSSRWVAGGKTTAVGTIPRCKEDKCKNTKLIRPKHHIITARVLSYWKYTTARNWHNGEDEVISLDLEQL